ncbi:34005_t:CDS:1 [Racocetra persica]|uniref:34005_t:CDS:1 n=1 Tax=Racocetra persica TaxID=160502 RepID=A0ACA9QI85_9GLOM|nr:34005_t:CDS:1 [Racocetra persica]
MAMEQFAEQFETRYTEKMSEWGLLDKEKFLATNGLKNNCPSIAKLGHWLRGKIISYESQHYEVADAYEGTRAIVKILRDTLNHIEEEKKLNRTEAEREEESEYELVDEEIVKLEAEKQE